MDTTTKVYQIISSGKDFSILDDNKNSENKTTYIFHKLHKYCIANTPGEVDTQLKEIEKYSQLGFYAAGYFSYELGYLFSSRTYKLLNKENPAPLLYMGIYEEKLEVDDDKFEAALENFTHQKHSNITNCYLNMSKNHYLEQLEKVKQHIFDGNTYQINYTLKYKFEHSGTSLKLYADLRKRQKVEYGAFLNFPNITIMSRSPELFVKKQGEYIYTKPMKGTCRRGSTPEQDQVNFEFLSSDEKSRAENVMIVDLLRNDLSRICQKNSVKTTDLFEVQTYETLHQMVSTVSAKIDRELPLSKLLKEIFPCGSITGAPKIRTMEIIHDLEVEARGVYTGAIGYINPDNNLCFNVPIRTLMLTGDGNGEMGIGSGVIADSDLESEYDECLLKGKFFTQNSDSFSLIECFLHDNNGYQYLEQHLQRLSYSANKLDFRLNSQELEEKLIEKSNHLKGSFKIRVILHKSGAYNIEHMPIEVDNKARLITLSKNKVFSDNWMLKYKSTKRSFYNEEYQKYNSQGYYDVIFTNEKNEITEGSFNNIFIRKKNIWYTPPVECGLLPGIKRQQLLSSTSINAQEKILFIGDLETADEIFLTNSVRGTVKTQLELLGEESSCYV